MASVRPVIVTKIKAIWGRPWVRRALLAAFLTLIAVLLIRSGRAVECSKVAASIRSYDASI